MIVIEATPSDPIANKSVATGVTKITSRPSLEESSMIETSKSTLVCPAGMITLSGTPEKSTPLIASPLTTNETSKDSSIEPDRVTSTVEVAAPFSQRNLSRAAIETTLSEATEINAVASTPSETAVTV